MTRTDSDIMRLSTYILAGQRQPRGYSLGVVLLQLRFRQELADVGWGVRLLVIFEQRVGILEKLLDLNKTDDDLPSRERLRLRFDASGSGNLL